MGWTANATVTSVNGGNVVLAASDEHVTSDGDDNVTAVTVEISGPIDSHLAVGSQVQITANC